MRRKRAQPDLFRRVVGRPVSVLLEPASDPDRIDHVWVNLDVGTPELMRAVINTLSLRNQVAGFDSRVRVALVKLPFTRAPLPGIHRSEGLNYESLEVRHNLLYETLARPPLELLLCEKLRLADWIEVWGELYERGGPGIHQIHSRRASCAVAEDIRGRDGAFRCYNLATKTAELVLLKFCGQ